MSYQRPPHVTGVVLAGGQSRRFGRNKALEPLLGRRMVDLVIDVVGPRVERTLVVAPDASPFAPDVEVIADRFYGAGPLAGLHAALTAIRSDWYLIVACDCPMVQPAVVDLILRRLESDAVDAVIPEAWGLLQPLQAAYSRRCLLPVEQHLQRGQLKMVDFVQEVQVDCVPVEEIYAEGGSLWSFYNVNTPEELAVAEAYLRGLWRGEPPSPAKRRRGRA